MKDLKRLMNEDELENVSGGVEIQGLVNKELSQITLENVDDVLANLQKQGISASDILNQLDFIDPGISKSTGIRKIDPLKGRKIDSLTDTSGPISFDSLAEIIKSNLK